MINPWRSVRGSHARVMVRSWCNLGACSVSRRNTGKSPRPGIKQMRGQRSMGYGMCRHNFCTPFAPPRFSPTPPHAQVSHYTITAIYSNGRRLVLPPCGTHATVKTYRVVHVMKKLFISRGECTTWRSKEESSGRRTQSSYVSAPLERIRAGDTSLSIINRLSTSRRLVKRK